MKTGHCHCHKRVREWHVKPASRTSTWDRSIVPGANMKTGQIRLMEPLALITEKANFVKGIGT